jgi:charged multivesicular body protein 4
MARLNETIENIGKKEDHLQRKIDAELANAKKFHTAGKKREAIQCIKRKKMYEQQLATLGTSKNNLEAQKMTMESMNMNADILDAQRVAAKAMQDQVKKVGGVDKVEELMDEVEDAQTDARDIQEAMGRQLEMPGVGDEEELLAELEGLMEEELTADLAKVELGRAVEMPSAPISLPAAGTKKVMTDEERELAELEAAMAG